MSKTPYCIPKEVNAFVKTQMKDKDMEVLIDLIDEDLDEIITRRELTLSTNQKKQLAIRMCCINIANREPEAAGAGDYGNPTRETQIRVWQKYIDELIGPHGELTDEIPILVTTSGVG